MLNDYEIQKKNTFLLSQILQFVASILILYGVATFIPGFVEEVQAFHLQESQQLKIRVIANSSSKEDQQQKQQIVDTIQLFLRENDGNSEHIHSFERIYQEIQNNFPKVNVEMLIGDNLIPAKVQNARFYPQNTYYSVVYKIGSGRGENWFCAVFPTLCIPDQQPKKERPPSFFYEWFQKKKHKN